LRFEREREREKVWARRRAEIWPGFGRVGWTESGGNEGIFGLVRRM